MTRSPSHAAPASAVALSAALLWACADRQLLEPPHAPPSPGQAASVAPSPLETVSFAPLELETELWPYTGSGFPGSTIDPVNLLVVGQTDARVLRAALLALTGDRSTLGFPYDRFDCSWGDAVGGNQTAYTTEAGWVGNALQLECGDFETVRFHLRFYPAGEWTLANAHLDVLVPGTHIHEVVSWDVAEAFVVQELLRTGLVAAVAVTDPINPVSPYRGVTPSVYNGLDASLREVIGGPEDDVTESVPIPNNGTATVLHVTGSASPPPGVLRLDTVLEFDQVIPRPFCAEGPGDFVHVKGSIHFRQRLVDAPSGSYVSQFHAQGRLELTPIDSGTGTPAGEPFHAVVNERYSNLVTDRTTRTTGFEMRVMIPPAAPFQGFLIGRMQVGPGESSGEFLRVECP